MNGNRAIILKGKAESENILLNRRQKIEEAANKKKTHTRMEMKKPTNKEGCDENIRWQFVEKNRTNRIK